MSWTEGADVTSQVGRSVDGGVATLTLDSPANRNALSVSLLADLRAGVADVVADPQVRVIVLSHTGPVFCSGMDLRATVDAPPHAQPVVAFPALLEAIWTCPKPVIARVGGKSRAGGVGLVAVCDLAVASTDADFAFTEVRLGLVPAVISAPVLPRVSARAAAELFLTGAVFDAARAAAIGLVSSAVAPERLDAEVARLAGLICLGAPDALAATKEILRRAKPSLAVDLDELGALSAAAFAGPEGQEGIAAFRDKRPAAWVPVSGSGAG